MCQQTPVVAMDQIHLTFGRQEVLKDFSLVIEPGEKVLLTGPSGSGKSSILKCILGLLVPQSGGIRLFGEAVTGRTIWGLRQRLAYVGQEPDLGEGTVREVFERPFGFRANAALRGNLSRLPEWLARFDLPEAVLDKDLAMLSGGEKQRVALISAVLLDRSLILLDEASSALDTANKEAVAAFFLASEALTVVSIAHDTEWRRFATRVVEVGVRANPARGVA